MATEVLTPAEAPDREDTNPPREDPSPLTKVAAAAYPDLDRDISRARESWLERRGKVGEVMAEREAAVAPKMAGVSEAIAQPQPTPPGRLTLREPPNPIREFLAPVQGQAPESLINNMVNALGLFAQMGGALSRKHATSGLAAFAGAAQGWREGNQDKAKIEFTRWDMETKKAIAEHRSELDAYDAITKARDKTIEERIREAQLLAWEKGNKVLAAQFTADTYEKAIGQLQQERNHLDQVELKYATLIQSAKDKAEQRALLMQLEQMREAAMAPMRQALIDYKKMDLDFKRAQPARGKYYDSETGGVTDITVAEHQADLAGGQAGQPRRYHALNQSEVNQLDRLSLAPYMLDRLKVLTDKILAEAPGENITKGFINKLKKRGEFAPLIAEFENLKADAAVEMASALSGGAPRISILWLIRTDAQPSLGMTKETARAQINTAQTTIANRLTRLTDDPEAYQKVSRQFRPYTGSEDPDSVVAVGPGGIRKRIKRDVDLSQYPGWSVEKP